MSLDRITCYPSPSSLRSTTTFQSCPERYQNYFCEPNLFIFYTTTISLSHPRMPLLVRDFFTWETLFKLLRETALQPLLTGPLLYASIRDALLPSSLSFSRKTQILKILRVLFTLGTLRVANNTLSKLVLNNWTIDTWRKNEEVVLITGGGSGIGELMARDLAPYSKAIIVLDLIPSKMSMRTFVRSLPSSHSPSLAKRKTNS